MTPGPTTVRVLIAYEHISPHQSPALLMAAEFLARRGVELTVVEQYPSSRLHGWTTPDAPRGSAWVCLSSDDRRRPFRSAARLAREIRQRRIDVTVVNGWADPVAWSIVTARRWLGTRVVTVSDSTEVDRPRGTLKEVGKRAFLRNVEGVFAAGTRQVQYLERLGVSRDRVSLGCDVVQNDRFERRRPRAVPSPGEPVVIGTAARLDRVKNLAAALRALHRVLNDTLVPRITWRVAGRGPLEAELRALARSLGVDVEFLGFVPYDGMPAFYAGLDLYWQPSLSEPWGLAVNEAMASGLPILASDRCGCVDDLVAPGNGWVHGIGESEMSEGLRTAFAARDQWPFMGGASLGRIAAWDLDRFATGLWESVQIAMRSRNGVVMTTARPRPGLSE